MVKSSLKKVLEEAVKSIKNGAKSVQNEVSNKHKKMISFEEQKTSQNPAKMAPKSEPKMVKNGFKITFIWGLFFPELVFFLKTKRINGSTGGTRLKSRSQNLSFL